MARCLTVLVLALTSSAALAEDEVWLAVLINQQQPADTVLLLKRSDGGLLAGAKDLRRWRLRLPDVAPLAHDGDVYYPLDALAGLSYRLDESSLALAIDAPPPTYLMPRCSRGRRSLLSSPPRRLPAASSITMCLPIMRKG